MYWLKYKTKYASGEGRYEYLKLGTNNLDTAKHYAENFKDETNQSHADEYHYRGVEYEIITLKDVPEQEIVYRLERAGTDLGVAQRRFTHAQEDYIEWRSLWGIRLEN